MRDIWSRHMVTSFFFPDCVQDHVLDDKQCRRIVGEVRYEDYLSEVFKRDPPVEIHGKLMFERTAEVDLSAIEHVTVVGHGSMIYQ